MDTNSTQITPAPSFRVATWAAARSPRWLLESVALSGGSIHYAFARRKRRSFLANTSSLFPAESSRHPRHAFQNHALNVLELLRAVRQTDGEILSRVTLHGHDHIGAALAQGRGLIVTTFHSGNWELAGLALALQGYPITTVAGEQLCRGWSDSVKALKERFGIRVVSPQEGARKLVRDLEANRVVVLHLDGDVFASGTAVSFLGKQIRVPNGPVRLSRLAGSPIGFAYCRRKRNRRLDVFIEAPMPRVAAKEDELAVTRALAARVEKCIAKEPHQWCIFRDLQQAAET